MIEAVYNACVRCGLCLPTCPTYLETMTETSGPRGRISLIADVDQGRLELLSPGFVEQMSQCLDCRACEAACPSGVRYGSLLEEMRARIERAQAPNRSAGRRRVRELLLHRLFRSGRLMRAAAAVVRAGQRTGLHVAAARLLGLGDAAALAPEIPERAFVPNDQRYEVAGAAGTAFLHAGCVMSVAFAPVHEATIRMLNRARMNVVVPRDQGCCGAIAVHAGEPDFARELAKRNIVAFERSGADVYVVNAAGCGSALKETDRLFADDPEWSERAARFSARVRDAIEVLDAMDLDPRIGALDVEVTYQEPCHLVHAQRVSAAPRRLLAQIPGLRLIEMEERTICCGGAGIYNLTQPEMAKRLQRRKVEHIRATGAAIVVTANPGCAMQVASGLRSDGSRVEVKHLVELLDEAYARYGAAVNRA
ncbi:MAG: (Fe-S)-binding protein [bacterium]|nr:(Fe-S)-binding protein [bacterium]